MAKGAGEVGDGFIDSGVGCTGGGGGISGCIVTGFSTRTLFSGTVTFTEGALLMTRDDSCCFRNDVLPLIGMVSACYTVLESYYW